MAFKAIEKNRSKIWRMIPHGIIRPIWSMRNKISFGNEALNIQRLKMSALSNMGMGKIVRGGTSKNVCKFCG